MNDIAWAGFDCQTDIDINVPTLMRTPAEGRCAPAPVALPLRLLDAVLEDLLQKSVIPGLLIKTVSSATLPQILLRR